MKLLKYFQVKQVKGRKVIYSLMFMLGLTLISPSGPASASSTINLGSAGKFQILAGSVITLGVGVLGAEPEFDGVSSSAVADLQLAIASASSLSGTTGTADLGSHTYTPGVYLSPGGAAFAVTGDVILDGMGNTNSEFIFYTPAAMNTTAGIKITLINGAQTRNIYWIAGGAITLGASNSISGIFMSSAAITTGAVNTFTGCLLSAAAVTVGAGSVFNPCPLTEAPLPTGSLTISVPEAYSLPESSPGSAVSANIGQIKVVDTRAGGAETTWIADVSSTDLVDNGGHVISAAAIKYLVKDLLNSGGVTTLGALESPMNATFHAVTASGISGSNSTTWNAQISVLVPIGQAIGSYSGILTHSVY